MVSMSFAPVPADTQLVPAWAFAQADVVSSLAAMDVEALRGVAALPRDALQVRHLQRRGGKGNVVCATGGASMAARVRCHVANTMCHPPVAPRSWPGCRPTSWTSCAACPRTGRGGCATSKDGVYTQWRHEKMQLHLFAQSMVLPNRVQTLLAPGDRVVGGSFDLS